MLNAYFGENKDAQDAQRFYNKQLLFQAAVSLELAIQSARHSDQSEISALASRLTDDPNFFNAALSEAEEDISKIRHMLAHANNMQREEWGLLITLISGVFTFQYLICRYKKKIEIPYWDEIIHDFKDVTDNFQEINFRAELNFLRSNAVILLPDQISNT